MYIIHIYLLVGFQNFKKLREIVSKNKNKKNIMGRLIFSI